MGTVNIFVGNNLMIDFEIYSLWVDGYSAEECSEQISRKDPVALETKESIVLRDILDHYLLFNKLEQYLHSPPNLKEQLLFQVSDELANRLIEKYYEYDTLVMRELLGLKLTQRQRKDLDDVSDKTGYRVRSCRRQFDNLKRINRVTEDLKGSLFNNIIENFLLPPKIAEQYAAIVFITRNQFELSKRKLNHLQLDDFIYCANQMIKNWSGAPNTDYESEFSRDFLINLKDLKIFVEKDFIDDHKKLVISAICNKTIYAQISSENRTYYVLDQNFKDLSKALIDIAYTLNHSKDMKDLFVDLFEQFIEPCFENGWTKDEVRNFLDEYRKRAHQMPNICRDNPKLLSVFDRYIQTISNCIVRMYHS